MKMHAIAAGVAAGAAAGTVGYLLTAGSPGEKSKLKKRTVKAMHAIGAVMDSLSDFMR